MVELRLTPLVASCDILSYVRLLRRVAVGNVIPLGCLAVEVPCPDGLLPYYGIELWRAPA